MFCPSKVLIKEPGESDTGIFNPSHQFFGCAQNNWLCLAWHHTKVRIHLKVSQQVESIVARCGLFDPTFCGCLRHPVLSHGLTIWQHLKCQVSMHSKESACSSNFGPVRRSDRLDTVLSSQHCFHQGCHRREKGPCTKTLSL